MIPALGGVLIAGIALPHLLRLERASPLSAAVIWASALALRALTGVFLALYVIFFLPATELFSALTHWCWHAVLPMLASHLGLDGHNVGAAASVAPAVLLAASLLSVAFGLARAARAVRRLLSEAALGRGPGDSVVVGGSQVVLAAAGLRRPRLLVSAGALTQLDDEELAAGLDHERGHIVRRHRYLLVWAEACRALGRFVPGTRAAAAQLAFHLERDADRWALARRHDRLALAGAIAKAAVSQMQPSPLLASLAGATTGERLHQLLHDPPPSSRSVRGVALSVLAGSLVALTLALSAAIPATVSAGVQEQQRAQALRHCAA